MLNILVAPYDYNINGEKYAKRIVRYLKTEKIEYSVYFSPKIEDIGKNANALSNEGETDFVVVGDEQILHEFLNNVEDISKIKLGIIPLGKHDDLASYLDLESNPLNAIKRILQNKVKQIDYMFVNDKIVINNILIGASCELFEVYNQFKMKNIITKNWVLMQYGNNFEGIELTIENEDNPPFSEQVFELSISNAGSSKNLQISPLSNLTDGLINFNYCTSPEREKRKKYLKLFKKGNQIYDENTKQFWVKNLKITNAEQKIKALVDGKIENFEQLDISIVPSGLKIFNTIEKEVPLPVEKKKKSKMNEIVEIPHKELTESEIEEIENSNLEETIDQEKDKTDKKEKNRKR